MSNPLSTLPVPTLKILAKMAEEAVADRREELGQTKGVFTVDQTIVLRATGNVSVAKSTPDAIIAQAAKPWALLAAALEEANQRLAAAGQVGLDLKRLVEMAEIANPEMAKAAEEKAKEHLKAIKEEVRGFRWGSVSVKEGNVEVLSKEDHRPQLQAVGNVPF